MEKTLATDEEIRLRFAIQDLHREIEAVLTKLRTRLNASQVLLSRSDGEIFAASVDSSQMAAPLGDQERFIHGVLVDGSAWLLEAYVLQPSIARGDRAVEEAARSVSNAFSASFKSSLENYRAMEVGTARSGASVAPSDGLSLKRRLEALREVGERLRLR